MLSHHQSHLCLCGIGLGGEGGSAAPKVGKSSGEGVRVGVRCAANVVPVLNVQSNQCSGAGVECQWRTRVVPRSCQRLCLRSCLGCATSAWSAVSCYWLCQLCLFKRAKCRLQLVVPVVPLLTCEVSVAIGCASCTSSSVRSVSCNWLCHLPK